MTEATSLQRGGEKENAFRLKGLPSTFNRKTLQTMIAENHGMLIIRC